MQFAINPNSTAIRAAQPIVRTKEEMINNKDIKDIYFFVSISL